MFQFGLVAFGVAGASPLNMAMRVHPIGQFALDETWAAIVMEKLHGRGGKYEWNIGACGLWIVGMSAKYFISRIDFIAVISYDDGVSAKRMLNARYRFYLCGGPFGISHVI